MSQSFKENKTNNLLNMCKNLNNIAMTLSSLRRMCEKEEETLIVRQDSPYL